MLHQMPPHARLWVYSLAQPMDAITSTALADTMQSFVEEWEAHGASLAAGFEIWGNQILLLAVDEKPQAATGCSIDKSVHLLQSFGTRYGLDFFNRMLVQVPTEGDQWQAYTTAGLKDAIAAGRVNGETRVLNTLAPSLEAFGNGLIPLRDSWAARYLG